MNHGMVLWFNGTKSEGENLQVLSPPLHSTITHTLEPLYAICSPTAQITSLLGRERKLREVLLGIGSLDEDRPHQGE